MTNRQLWRENRAKQIPRDPANQRAIDIIFADDSRQLRPSRPGMGELVAIGGINIPAEEVRELNWALDALCTRYGFPSNEEFKWSPGPELWMRSNLVGEQRKSFFLDVIQLLAEKNAVAVVVIEDKQYGKATPAATAETDVTTLFLERIDQLCVSNRAHGIIIADRPGGSERNDNAFLAECLEMLETGTAYVKPKNILHNVVSTPSHLSRLLQVADVITSCTLAFVAGESKYSPSIFEAIKPLFNRQMDRIGGYGIKIHPDSKYSNLYHWLLGDSHYWRLNSGFPMPISGRPYSQDANTP